MLTHRRKTRRRLPLLAGVLTGLLGLVALLGTALAAITPGAAPLAAAPPATPDADCALLVPPNPLTATGLATPYRLTATDPAKGPCHEADPAQSAFVQATILDPATGALSVYDPLVVDRGTHPARTSARPKLPARAVVALWFGFNGNNLTLRGALSPGRCVNGSAGSLFGQFAYCNAPAFFAAARGAERAGRLKVPPLGVGRDGAPCPSTRDFGLVDQDQSDNVTTAYLTTANGRTAQRTAPNEAALGGGTGTILNGSDNLLLTAFVDPALGCTPWTAPDLADPGHAATSLALDEIQAAAGQRPPVALVPLTDPMVLGRDGAPSHAKTDLYRAGVDQPALGRGPAPDHGDGAAYCANLARVGTARLRADQSIFAGAASPVDGQNLFDFLTARLSASLTTLGCAVSPPAPSGTATGPGTSATPAPSGTAAGPGTSATPAPSGTAGAAAAGSSGGSSPLSGPGAPATVATGAPASPPAGTAPATAADTLGAPASPGGTARTGPGLVPPTERQAAAPTPTSPTPTPFTSAPSVVAPALAPVGDVVPATGPTLIGAATARVTSPAPSPPVTRMLAATGRSVSLPPLAGLACSLLLLAGSVILLLRSRR
ncbi:hypothetical protein ABIA32_006163 [Streptacidiphilus sp. MAP12-20]|uniref:hypothetical protein n=1 Tax=Streptacidiphilus sp. MAP12-20 TaxID=3156299 RepID=UPI003512980A